MGDIFEDGLVTLIFGLFTGVPTSLFYIVSYILTSLAIYTIASRRGLRKAWLAWIPVVNSWLMGSISDQYSYVVRGEIKSRRKWLLVLRIIKAALTAVLTVLATTAVAGMIFRGPGFGMRQFGTGSMLGALGVILPLTAVNIAYLVIRFMALFDVYRSVDPGNSVLYLVLSILFSPATPFFLFFNRNKDLGMPPRKQKTVDAEWAETEYV